MNDISLKDPQKDKSRTKQNTSGVEWFCTKEKSLDSRQKTNHSCWTEGETWKGMTDVIVWIMQSWRTKCWTRTHVYARSFRVEMSRKNVLFLNKTNDIAGKSCVLDEGSSQLERRAWSSWAVGLVHYSCNGTCPFLQRKSWPSAYMNLRHTSDWHTLLLVVVIFMLAMHTFTYNHWRKKKDFLKLDHFFFSPFTFSFQTFWISFIFLRPLAIWASGPTLASLLGLYKKVTSLCE